jgi:dynein light chain LC8-type
MSSSNTNTGNVEGKSSVSRKGEQDKVFIIESDMEDDMQFAAIEIASKDPRSNPSNHELAQKLKDNFESKYYPTWNCIVGKSFGCKINAQKKHYLCFQIGDKTVILYKFR